MKKSKNAILTKNDKTSTPFFNKEGPENSFFQKKEETNSADEEKKLMRKEASSTGVNNTVGDISSTLNSKKGQGQPLPAGSRSKMESAFGTGFEDVNIHTDAEAVSLSDSLNAHAFTYGQDIFFNKSKFSPGTLEGDGLLAHELTHTIQQKGEGKNSDHFDNETESNANSVTESVLNKIILNESKSEKPTISKKGISVQRCNGCSSPPRELTFTQVSAALARPEVSGNTTAKEEVIQAGIRRARRVARELFNDPAGPTVSTIRTRINTETGVPLEGNPMVGVSQDNVEQAYRAWFEGAVTDPWVLLAIWKKEGLGNPDSETAINSAIPATTEQNAKSIYRSRYFYFSTGSDHFGYYEATPTDNVMHFDDAHAAQHESTFLTRVQEMVDQGYLVRNIATEINAELTVNPQVGGNFTVTPTSRFRALALMLTDAFFRANATGAAANPSIGANPDPGLTYMRWNMGETRFNRFVTSADTHRAEPAHAHADGSMPSVSEWAFHTNVRDGEYDQPRRNAIRFRYFMEVFRNIYE